ncbi:MAG: alpha/beta hydrolase [Pirellulaceae bacterium]|nr:alpha/beta hydrolase [Pirellulaceae bacterium]
MRKLKRTLQVLIIGYLLVCIVLMFLENSLVYPAPKFTADDLAQPNWNARNYGAEDVQFASADGTQLHGWYWQHSNPQGHLLYCHGNGDCVGYLGDYLADLSRRHRLSVFVFDYRGYGRSEGSPSEVGILQDGVAARNWLAARAAIAPEEVILMGRSLGGAVCVDLAANSGARGLILQNTFTSLPDAAASIYWFLPVRWLMRNQYRSIDKIERYAGPLLQSHGDRDRIVPFAIGQRLFKAAPGTKRFFTIEGGDHNDPEPDEYSKVLEDFLSSLHHHE